MAITLFGNRVKFSGFQFTSGTITGIPIQVAGSENLLTQLNFDGYSAQKYINIIAPSRSNEVAYCNFRNKPASAPQGNLIHVGADASVVGYHKIRYCSFQDMPGGGGDNGNECIRLSNGAQSEYIARTVVEYCYFNNTGPGDSEAVSVKCRENVIRYCTFTNNPDAMLEPLSDNYSMPIPDFVKSLRSKIGTESLQLPVVSTFAYDNQGRLLLIQDKDSGRWSAPSGIVDPHELPSDAAVRETWEEAGVFVELTRILGVFAGEHFSKTYDNGDQLAAVTTVFAARVIRGTPRPDHEETSDARFFSPGEIDALSCSMPFLVIRKAGNQTNLRPNLSPPPGIPAASNSFQKPCS